MKSITTLKKAFLALLVVSSFVSCNITDYIVNQDGKVESKSTGATVTDQDIKDAEADALGKGKILPWP